MSKLLTCRDHCSAHRLRHRPCMFLDKRFPKRPKFRLRCEKLDRRVQQLHQRRSSTQTIHPRLRRQPYRRRQLRQASMRAREQAKRSPTSRWTARADILHRPRSWVMLHQSLGRLGRHPPRPYHPRSTFLDQTMRFSKSRQVSSDTHLIGIRLLTGTHSISSYKACRSKACRSGC